ncbi:hypothetical protein [Rheinheimera hassiensis]|uniref:hypothetical protein n=1 Tax=Rheinheimera hassiensis TaxID=1193627 RepID=UPI001F0533DA|nr:hypothetical protein [Rheinheimera hassiensis]
MNFAVPAILIFILLLPGFIFLNAFEKSENTELERKPFQASSAGAFAVALVLQVFFCNAVNALVEIDINLFIKVLMAVKLTDAELISISKNYVLIAGYFISSFVVAFLLGKLLQKLLLELNPYKSSAFSFDTPWYYELKGKISEAESAQLIKVSCMQDCKDGTVFYYGYLQDFYLNKSGQLDRLVLSDVYRRKIESDETEDHTSNNARFYKIKGDRLVIKYEHILNLNIEYLYIEEIPK